jgi:hypothetical protein
LGVRKTLVRALIEERSLQQIFCQCKGMFNAVNRALSDKRQVPDQHLSSFLLEGQILVVASFGEEIDPPVTGTERYCATRYPGVVGLWEHWLQT